MKRQILWAAVCVLSISLACNLSSPPEPTPQIPTISVYAAEEANAGAHHYWMSPNELECSASEETSFAQFRDKELVFAPDFSSVSYGGRTYPRISEHRYQSINQDEKPLVLVFSEHGYVLYVYEPGKDPNVDDWCLTFSFTLAD